MTPKDLTSVEIVGGGSRVGCVKRTLAKILGLDTNATNNGLRTTMNADEAIARGAALQSAILSPRFKVLPYEIVEAQPFPVKVGWEGDDTAAAEGVEEATNSVVMFDRNSNFNIVRRVTLRRPGEFIVTASYDDKVVEKYGFPEGAGQGIVQFKIKAPEGNSNKVRVNVKQDINGTILLSSAQMIEEIVDETPAPEAPKEGETKEGETDASAEEGKKEEEKVEKKK